MSFRYGVWVDSPEPDGFLISHDLHTKSVVVNVFGTDDQVIPADIDVLDENVVFIQLGRRVQPMSLLRVFVQIAISEENSA